MQKVKQFAFERKDQLIRAGGALGLVMVLVLSMALTVFADTTYRINDGEQQLIYKTDATEPEEVLEEAGLALAAGDLITTEEGFLSSTINIRRAVDVVINYYGEVKTVFGYEDETLADVLAREELTWNVGDVLSQELDMMVYDGLNLAITSIVTKEEVYNETIAFETTYVDDDNMKKGAEKVTTEGQDGEKVVTASVTYINGVETNREILNEEVTTEVVDEVIAVGTGKNVKTYRNGSVVIGNGTITLENGKVLTYSGTRTVTATAYTSTDPGCGTKTSTGTTVRWGTVAVDPRYIPYGTKMFIVSNDGYIMYGEAVAEDCGGAIKKNKIDLYMPSHSQCINFGRRTCTVYFING
ncbi:MAG: G5 domain-containing protein [Oscillospiraceae bacterium]|nr:G5 domain-containing protein [Oscillospiraceae bacterium]